VIDMTVARRHRTYPSGRLRYVIGRLSGMIVPPVQVSEPEPGSVEVDHNVPVTVRDGTVLRVNVHRPPGDGPFPAILAAHPYGVPWQFPDHYVTRRSGQCRVH
jgi:predicted acyl esterase